MTTLPAAVDTLAANVRLFLRTCAHDPFLAPLSSSQSTPPAADRARTRSLLRVERTRPDPAAPAADTILVLNSLWERQFTGVLPAPAWQERTRVANSAHPVTVFSSAVDGHDDLTLLAAVMLTADRLAVTFVAAAPCSKDPYRHAIVALKYPPQLAGVLQRHTLRAVTDHETCHPSHGRGTVSWSLNKDEQAQCHEESATGR